MEQPAVPNPELQRQHILRRLASGFISELRFVRKQLSTADLNPHEGRLRASAMPANRMDIPDYPPVHDDTL